MKAIVQERYGPPDAVLRLREVETPVPGPGEVLVRVRAASVHPDVWHVVTGRPYALRLVWAGLRRPEQPIPGTDLAGVVEAVGEGVTRFRPGDAVFGETYPELAWRNGGAFAELAAVSQEVLAPKPEGISFEQAAAVPNSGVIALLNLQGGRLVRPGDHVLVNGAGGGVGSIAVQLAKFWGARVTGVDRTAKLEMVRELGADRVIDFTREDVIPSASRDGERYDLVFDVASNLSIRACRRALTPEGVYVFIGHDHFGAAKGRVLGSIPRGIGYLLLSRLGRHRHLPRPSGAPLTKGRAVAILAELLEAGELTPVVDRTYPLGEVTRALGRLQEGRGPGRILITP